MIKFIKKYRIQSSILIIIIFILVIVQSISNKPNGDFHYENGYRIDQEPIKSRFPELGNFKSCYWKGGSESNNYRTVPGPSTYWMKGFVVLDSNTFNKFKNNYDWNNMDKNWEPTVGSEVLKIQSFDWRNSEEFDESIFNSSIDYVGDFYLDFNNGVVYFDIESI